jgi:hypothetical protein
MAYYIEDNKLIKLIKVIKYGNRLFIDRPKDSEKA